MVVDWSRRSNFLQSYLAEAPSQISNDGTVCICDGICSERCRRPKRRKRPNSWRNSEPTIDGLRVEYGSDLFNELDAPAAELIGLAFAIIILIVAFGSVLAMGLPIGTALAGIGVGSMILMLSSHFVMIPDVGSIIGVMIGLGVGIDYALFIVTRYREQLHSGHTVEESVTIAIDTSGRAVAFAGLTVVISLLGMLLIGIGFVSGLAIAAATIVLVTLVGSLTLLPALLGYAGRNVEITRWRGLIGAGLVAVGLLGIGLDIQLLTYVSLPLAVLVILASFVVNPLRRHVPPGRQRPLRETIAFRWSRLVQARPWPLAIASATLLLVLAFPLLDIRLGFSDAGNNPEDSSARQAYDLLSDGFGPGSNGTVLLVARIPDSSDISNSAQLLAVTDAVAATDGVASVSLPVPSNQVDPGASNAVLWTVVPETSPQDAATTDLVNELRDSVLPSVTQDSDLDILVTGTVAVQVDFSEYLSGRMLVFFAAVLGLSFLLLMMVFRSILVPLKAVIMNLLSIGAAYGVMVAVFQWGWAGNILGLEPAPIEPFLPMMLFAIVFGLSMDYEVFLLSRVREEWLRTGDSHLSVADGLASTARVITAAAAIMTVVFGGSLWKQTGS
ncbi:MAG: MMPL family transporter [Thermomicrobiales bacterium]